MLQLDTNGNSVANAVLLAPHGGLVGAARNLSTVVRWHCLPPIWQPLHVLQVGKAHKQKKQQSRQAHVLRPRVVFMNSGASCSSSPREWSELSLSMPPSWHPAVRPRLNRAASLQRTPQTHHRCSLQPPTNPCQAPVLVSRQANTLSGLRVPADTTNNHIWASDTALLGDIRYELPGPCGATMAPPPLAASAAFTRDVAASNAHLASRTAAAVAYSRASAARRSAVRHATSASLSSATTSPGSARM